MGGHVRHNPRRNAGIFFFVLIMTLVYCRKGIRLTLCSIGLGFDSPISGKFQVGREVKDPLRLKKIAQGPSTSKTSWFWLVLY